MSVKQEKLALKFLLRPLKSAFLVCPLTAVKRISEVRFVALYSAMINALILT